jgi:hypothetical protein
MRKRPLVVKVPVQLPPEPMPLIVPTDAPVESNPDGTPVPAGEHVPDDESQMSMFTDLIVVDVGGVNVNVYELLPAPAELLRVKAREVSCAACAGESGRLATAKAREHKNAATLKDTFLYTPILHFSQ